MPPDCPINCFDSFLVVGVRTRGKTILRPFKLKEKQIDFFPILKRDSFFMP